MEQSREMTGPHPALLRNPVPQAPRGYTGEGQGPPKWASLDPSQPLRALAKGSGVRFELAALAALFLLTGTLGRTFSKLELGFSWLHPTEVVLVAVLAAALLRTPPREWGAGLRATRIVAPLLILWLCGAIAVARGVVDWGWTRVLYDVGLVEYSVFLPLLALVIRDRDELRWICRVIVLACLLAIVSVGLSDWTPTGLGLSSSLNLIEAASGMYLVLYVAWIAARSAAGVAIQPWQSATVIVAVGLIILGSARSAWLGLFAALAIVGAFSPAGRRLAFAGRVLALLVLGSAVSTASQQAHRLDIPSPASGATATANLMTSGAPAASATESRTRTVTQRDGQGETTLGDGGAPSAVSNAAHESADRTNVKLRPQSISANPGIESGDLDGYTSFGSNLLGVSADRAVAGRYSIRATYGDDLRLAKTVTFALPSDVPNRASAWVYVPRAWDGGAIALGTDGTWTGASEATGGNSTGARGVWARIHTELTPSLSDLEGGIHIRALSPPSTGKQIYIDNLTVRPIPGSRGERLRPDNPVVAADDGARGLSEFTASFRDSPQQANAQWRLAFWKFMVKEAAQRPLLGVGFGAPSNFEWNGIRYDSRTGDPTDPFDVSGPHNSFLNVLYRTGLPGFLALVAIMLIAFVRVVAVIKRTSGGDKALAIWLAAGIVTTTVSASFNVALEGPFMGIFFWAFIGLALLAPRFLPTRP
jgi:hypothetical protein